MYRVVKYFTDRLDGEYPYNVGDRYPRDGGATTEARTHELSSNENLLHAPLIEFVEEKEGASEISERVYTESDLSELTSMEIRTLAEDRGYDIPKGKRTELIAQFLEQQERRNADGV